MTEKAKMIANYADSICVSKGEMLDFCKSYLEGVGYVVQPAPENVVVESVEKTECQKFRADMRKAGFKLDEYQGRNFWKGPGVYTNEYRGPTKADVIRATAVKLQWDNMGVHYVVYPVEREGSWGR